LNTLNELATALNNDPDFANTVINLLAGKSDLGHTHTASEITDFDTQVRTSTLNQMTVPDNFINMNN